MTVTVTQNLKPLSRSQTFRKKLFEQLSTKGQPRFVGLFFQTRFKFEYTMSPVLPFEILDLIIDIVGENNDINVLKVLALVCHSFLQICSKHLFSTVELKDRFGWEIVHVNIRSSKNLKGFVKLLKRRPDVVKYIRKLTYKISSADSDCQSIFSSSLDDDLLSPILPNFLRTIPRLNCLKINASQLDWYSLNSSLTSAFLHLMHLPTLNHIDLSNIRNLPLSSLTPSVNLLRLDISHLIGRSPDFVVQSEMMPKIREFHTSDSPLLTTKLLHVKMKDGRPAVNFTDLRRLSMSFNWRDDGQDFLYILRNVKLLESLYLSVGPLVTRSLVGFLSPHAHTLKVLNLKIPFYPWDSIRLPLGGICEELEAMAGHNVLESLSCEIRVYELYSKDFIGPVIQNIEKVLIEPGWSLLRQVSLKVSYSDTRDCTASAEMFAEDLQSLPDEYLSHLSKLESVAFDYSVYAF